MSDNNLCGECRACCIHLPVADPDLVKAAGTPCSHLCDKGCSIFEQPDLPSICKGYLCEWRSDPWMNKRPLYRPDKLGVIFSRHHLGLVVTEIRPDALKQQAVSYIKNRFPKHIRGECLTYYAYGSMDGYIPESIGDEAYMEGDCEYLGGGERIVRRVSLPVIR